MNKKLNIILSSAVLIIVLIFLVKILEAFFYSNFTFWLEVFLLVIFSFLFFSIITNKFKSYKDTIKNYKDSLYLEKYNMNERIKELTCLYKINEYSENEEISNEQYFYYIVKSITQAMQFIDNSNCEIIYEDKIYLANNKKKKVFLESVIEVNKIEKGKLIVYYDKDIEFLKEEKDLIKTISRIISRKMITFEKKNEIEILIKKLREFEDFVNESAIVSKTDAKGNIIYSNKKFSDISGWSTEDLFGSNHRILNSGVHKKSLWKEMYNATINEKKIWNQIITNINKNGELYYVDTFIKAEFDSYNNLIGFSSIRQDVTDLKRKESELSSRMNAINKSSAVIEFDIDGKIIYANDKFTDLMGYTEEELKGKHHNIFLNEEYKKSKEYKQFWGKLKSGEFVTSQFSRIKKDGSIIWFQATYNPIKDSNDNVYRIMKIALDITDSVKNSKEIEKKNTYLEHAAKILRHDMHSGINIYIPRGISALEKRLSKEQIEDLKIEYPIKIISEGLKHAQKVYKGVYEFTNLVKKDAHLSKENLNLKAILESYLKTTSYSDSVKIEELVWKDVNESLFCTAIDNLIRNGLKYNDSTKRLVNIYMEDDKTLIIQDNGRGLTQEEFDNLSKSYTRKQGQAETGSGLGLSICKAILEEHKFSIYCEKNKIGTKISIKI